MDISEILPGRPLLPSLLPAQVDMISRFSSQRRLDRGEVPYVPDRKATHVFVLREG